MKANEASKISSPKKMVFPDTTNVSPVLRRKERVGVGSTNRKSLSAIEEVSASFSKEPAQLPKTFGATINSFPVQANPERLRQSTKSFAARTTRQPDPDEKRKKADFLRESRMKLDETWHIPIGLRALGNAAQPPQPQQVSMSGDDDELRPPPPRFSVPPFHHNTFDTVTGAEGTAFYETDAERFKTTKQTLDFSFERPPYEKEKEQKRLKADHRAEIKRQSQTRVEQTVKQEDESKLKAAENRLTAKAEQLKQYHTAVAAREARGGIF